jgi:DNA-binding MarR family transcriptional regulator
VTVDARTPPLAQLTGFLLRRAFLRASSCTKAYISANSEIENVHVREVAILAILDERGPMSQRQLSDITRVDRTLVVRLIDSLEARGWVQRERSTTDRRAYALHLTAAGQAALAQARIDLTRSELALTRRLTEAQRSRLREHLLALIENDEWLEVDTLAGQTGFLIARAHRRVRGWAVEALRPLGIDPRDFSVLAALAHEQPCTQNHLASVLGVTPPAIVSVVEELEGAGLVSRERNPHDRRFYDVGLTVAGRERLEKAAEVAAAVQGRVRARLGAQGDDELRALLAQVIAG